MPFQPGNKLAQGGRKDKPFADALRLEIAAAGGDHKALRRVARMLLQKAEEGDMQAINALADRLDGKPAQESTVDITTHRYVARIPEKATDADAWQKQHSPELTTH